MARDLAIDPTTGDFLFSAVRDLQTVEAMELLRQRVWVRLKIEKGWILDFTDGTLGSKLRTGLRMTELRVMDELPLMIEEALAPMPDITLRRVWVEAHPSDVRSVVAHVSFEPVLPILQQPQVPRPATELAFELGFV